WARIYCRLLFPKMLAMSTGRACSFPSSHRLGALLAHWPLFKRPRLAGLGCPPRPECCGKGLPLHMDRFQAKPHIAPDEGLGFTHSLLPAAPPPRPCRRACELSPFLRRHRRKTRLGPTPSGSSPAEPS